jgi:hypothetical protein
MKRLLWIAIALMLGVVVFLQLTPIPDQSARARDVARLARVIPLIDQLGLRSYRNEDGCRSIESPAGLYVSDLSGTICDFIDPSGVAFTAAAEQDFERIRQALAETGVGVFSVYTVDADPDNGGGGRRQVVFDLVERAVGRWAYVYEPGHVPAPSAPSDTYADIDENWYFMAWGPGEQ